MLCCLFNHYFCVISYLHHLKFKANSKLVQTLVFLLYITRLVDEVVAPNYSIVKIASAVLCYQIGKV